MKCPICSGSSVFLKNIEGYISDTFYDVYECNHCKSHHMDLSKLNKSIYDKIYSHSDKINGYDRYFKYMKHIKSEKNPLLWLSKQEDAYTPIYNILSQQKGLNVLEIGSGFGYLTYAINQLGHKCIGADISDVAVNKAKENFGDYYVQGDVFLDTKQSNVYDIVVATELIEHIDDYKKFFIGCHKVLKPGGKVLLTTPNKDFFGKKHIWIGDLPPIHTTWMTKQSFKLANQKIFSKVDFYPLGNYCKDTNYLFQKVLRNIIKRDSISKPVIRLDDNQEDVHNNINNGALYKFFLILQPIIEAKLIQKISNYINRKLFGSIDSCTTLCIVLEK